MSRVPLHTFDDRQGTAAGDGSTPGVSRPSPGDPIEALVAVTAEAMLLVAADGRVLAASAAACRLLGCGADGDGTPLDHLEPFDGDPSLAAAVARDLPQQAAAEFHVVDRAGRRVPVSASVTLLPDGRRRLLVLRDQTATRSIESVLRQRERRFRQFARIAADWLWEVDADLRFTRVEGRLLERNGIDARVVLSLTWAELVLPGDGQQRDWPSLRRTLLAREPLDECDLLVRFAPGHTHHLRVNAAPLVDAEGRFNGYRGSARDVSAEERAKRARTESENQFRAMFDHAAVGMVMVDLSGTIRRCNPEFCRMLGYEASELLGRHFADITHPDDREATVGRFPEPVLFADGKLELEKRYLHRDGSDVWARLTASLARDATGWPAFVFGMVEDITQRRAMHEALWRSEQSLRLVTENSPAAIHFKDREGRLLLVNRRTCEWFGIDPGEAVGRPARDWLGEALARHVEQEERRVLESRESLVTHHECVSADGRSRVLEMLKFPIFDENGEAVGVGGIDTDVTERLQAEEALRDSEERFRQLVEHLDDGVVVWDVASGAAVYRNPAFDGLWTSDGAPERLCATGGRDAVHAEDVERGRGSRQRALGGSASDAEYRLVAADGEVRWIWERALPVRNAQGAVYRVIGIFKDVTSLKLAEQQRLERAREQRDALLREVHHRIKNALQGIVGLLRRHADESPALRGVLDHATQQLDAVRVVYGSYAGQPSLVRMLELLVGGAGPGWRWSPGTDLVPALDRYQVHADEAVPVALVVSELLTNAVKHGGEAVAREGADVRVEAVDDGARVRILHPAPPLPAGFDFARGQGTGTGLELVRALLPPEGARLAFEWADGRMDVRLELGAPVLVTGDRP